MLHKWLTYQKRISLFYSFPVFDVTEVISLEDEIIAYLAKQILLAHGNPAVIIDDCRKLLANVIEDTDGTLAIINKYLGKFIS
jgi:hypothetical protein